MRTSQGSEWMSDFGREHRALGRAEGRAEGEAKGEQKAVLAVLRARRLAVSDVQRARILEMRDPDQLERWVEKAAVVGSADELFEG